MNISCAGDRGAIAFATTVAVERQVATSTNGDGGLCKASKCRHSQRMRSARKKTANIGSVF
jgi:hypothetical protein